MILEDLEYSLIRYFYIVPVHSFFHYIAKIIHILYFMEESQSYMFRKTQGEVNYDHIFNFDELTLYPNLVKFSAMFPVVHHLRGQGSGSLSQSLLV